ncbi:hypothetical protein COLO4_27860 [Corchorus olitorius]|uniref:SET domain-containing protein n=1 Tax=Corchorus olitorius TaxID=93759 RepID=A0A1R3HNT6_9ROSI|nr:hypothetical protein COLO4_27860 [Corchorus olitorius]
MQPRVSPRLHNLPNDQGDSSIEEISNGSAMKTPVNTRVSPRLQGISLEKRPFYGCSNRKKESNSVLMDALTESDTKTPLVTRASPRLKKIPLDKRPFYGSSCRKKRPNSVLEKTLNESDSKNPLITRVSPTEKILNDSDTKKPPNLRVSTRLQSIPLGKRPYYGSNLKKKPSNVSQDTIMVKSPKADNSTDSSVTVENGEKDVIDSEEIGLKVKNKLRQFNKYYLQFAQEEEKRCNGVKDSDHEIVNGKRKMRKNGEVIRHDRNFGDLPGIRVGQHFCSRAEMVAVGLHRRLLNGIDYFERSYGISDYSGYTFPLASAIVLSGKYEDDFDNSEEIIYTGEGGNDLLGKKHQVKDQVLCRGNLALKNNKEQSVPVRVIRGHDCGDSYSKTLYVYDGLYEVTDSWDEKGISGYIVYKYRLKRLRGQEKLRSRNQVHFLRKKASGAISQSPGIACEDLSNGQEDKRIPVLNLHTYPVAPTGKYIKSIEVSENVSMPPNAPGCNCKGKCTNSRSCSCARLNGGDFPYVSQDGGRLIEAKDVVFECGPNCGCGPECVNRTSQRGIKYHLEVYSTKDKGWAVRSLDFIPSGAPVCEYVGIIRRNDELDVISENDYIFEIDCWHTMKEIGSRERRLGDVCLPLSNSVKEVDEKTLESDPEPEFCIDASSSGNVARFINHSCDPNLFVQCILSSHRDIRLARIVLFASDNIPPMQELTYDYNYALDSVIGPDGKIKKHPCHCGAADCRKRLY